MLPILQLGGISLRLPGFVLLLGIWIGIELSAREGLRRGIDENKVYNSVFYSLILGVLAARLSFVFAHLDLYTGIQPFTRALGSVFALSVGTEILWIGTAAAVLCLALLIRRWNINPLEFADTIAPGIATFAIAFGLANLLGGDYYGIETNLPWGIEIWGAKRHPTQIYFTLVGIISLFIVLRLQTSNDRRGKQTGKSKKYQRTASQNSKQLAAGYLLQLLILILGSGILLIEPLRADSPIIGQGLRLWQILALVVMVMVLLIFAYRAPTGTNDSI